MTTLKFSTNKSDTLFLTFAIAVERGLSETTIHFAFWRSMFSVEISREPKITV